MERTTIAKEVEAEVNSMTTDRCIDIIRLSPMLRFFETGLSNEGVMPHSPTVHNVLESFSLLWSPRPGLVDQVLSSLTLPRLHTLNLDLVRDHDKNIIEDFLHRSAAPITSMELQFEQVRNERDLRVFQAIAALTPSLSHLRILYDDGPVDDGISCFNNSIFKYLVDSGKPKADNPSYLPPLPQLKSLTYSAARVVTKVWIPLELLPGLFPVSTSASGVPSLRPLKSLFTPGSFHPQKGYLRSLIPLRQAGIDFGKERNEDIDRIAARTVGVDNEDHMSSGRSSRPLS
ncbi:hypothetical protein D9613_004544 [Agrocybe pediades]|uniref:Uncharacterized protein n=1 Tax=Agrocybe pediades TaxID=84607 RepID=A0A8H4QK33_9AGAR|nr:hypothetical protein D9613_004544 [Agrocybe pediades]